MDKRASREKEEFWRLVIEEQRNSGLTARAFCRREGISEASFYGWRTRLNKRDGHTNEGGGQQLVPVQIVDSGGQKSQSRLVAGRSVAPASRTVEVVTPSGFLVRFDEFIEPTRLAELVGGIVALEKRATSSC